MTGRRAARVALGLAVAWASARAAGAEAGAAPPVRAAWRFGVEDGEAGPHYRAAFAAVGDMAQDRLPRLLDYDGAPPTPEDRAAALAVVRHLVAGARFRTFGGGPPDFPSVEAWCEAILPELSRARSIARLAYAAGRFDAPPLDDEETVAAGLACLVMGRHVSEPNGLVGGLVGIALRSIGFGLLAERAPRLPRAWRPELAAAVRLATDDATPLATLAFRSEADVARLNLRVLEGEGDPAERVKRTIAPDMRRHAPLARRVDPAYWADRTRELAAWHRRLADAWTAGGEALAREHLDDAALSDNPLARDMPEGMALALRSFTGPDVMRDAMLAGLACLDEPDGAKWAALPAMRDPARTDPPGPFAIERVDGGFVLKSAYEQGGRRPVSLRFAPPVPKPKPGPLPTLPMAMPGPPPPAAPVAAPLEEEVF